MGHILADSPAVFLLYLLWNTAGGGDSIYPHILMETILKSSLKVLYPGENYIIVKVLYPNGKLPGDGPCSIHPPGWPQLQALPHSSGLFDFEDIVRLWMSVNHDSGNWQRSHHRNLEPGMRKRSELVRKENRRSHLSSSSLLLSLDAATWSGYESIVLSVDFFSTSISNQGEDYNQLVRGLPGGCLRELQEVASLVKRKCNFLLFLHKRWKWVRCHTISVCANHPMKLK